MGRTSSISAELVSKAAFELIAECERPTARAVRARLGSGSMDTILRHLKTVTPSSGHRAIKTQAAQEEEIRLRSKAELLAIDNTNLLEQVGSLRQALGNALAQAEAADALRREIQDLKAKLASAEQEKQKAVKKAEQLEGSVRDWQLRTQHAQSQLNEAKDRIQRLEQSERNAIERAARAEARESAR